MKIFQSLYLAHFSKPVEDRVIYREIGAIRPKIIVEVGIQQGVRTQNILELAKKYCKDKEELQYYCIDPFEGRAPEDGCGLSLRKVHRMLNLLDIRFRPFPADPKTGIAQLSKSVQNTDLLVVASPENDWIFKSVKAFEALLGPASVVFVGKRGEPDTPYAFERFQRDSFLSRFGTIEIAEPETVKINQNRAA